MKILNEFCQPKEVNLLVCYVNIQGFRHTVRKMRTTESLEFLHQFRSIITDAINDTDGAVIRLVGDMAVIIFEEEDIEENVTVLKSLKKALEDFIQSRGFDNRVTFSINLGPVVIGYIGKEPNRQLEIQGETFYKTTSMAAIKPMNAGLYMTPEVFNKMESREKENFSKCSLPCIYWSE